MFVYSLIPVEDYTESTPDKKAYIDHLDKKKNKHVQGRYGSNIQKPLALRQMMYAESVKYESNIDSIKKVLDIEGKFRLCKRCANELHHGINICNK